MFILGEENTITKKCTSCRKQHTETTKCCLACKTYAQERRIHKKEEINEWLKQDRKNNPEKYKEYNKKNYEKYKEKRKEDRRNSYAENPETQKKASSEYYAKKCDEINEQRRQNYAENAEEKRQYSVLHSNSRNGKMTSIIGGARKRGIHMGLSNDDIMNMTDLDCAYCGEITSNVSRNGIDRLDSSVGYTIDNCVSCCRMCNKMKVCLDFQTFIDRCSQISFNHNGIGYLTDNWIDIKFTSFHSYKNKAIKTGKYFELTEEYYIYLRNRNCVYCNRSTTKSHYNGIDRLDSSIGYTIENCVTCCYDCNIAKNSTTHEEFIDQCKKIAKYKHTINCNVYSRQLHIIKSCN